MAEPLYRRFTFSSKVEECIQPPADPAKDPCKIEMEETTADLKLTAERRGDKFQLLAADLPKVAKPFPKYRPPTQELLEYIFLNSEFAREFGTESNPSETAKKILVVTKETGENTQAPFTYIGSLSNFISHHQLAPIDKKMKEALETIIRVSVYTSADPALGDLLVKILKDLKNKPQLSPDSQKRIEWLLGFYNIRKKFWDELDPAFRKSELLAHKVKSGSIDILTFLVANHVMADKGYKDYIYSDSIKEAAKIYHEFFTKTDPDYHPSKNFYHFMKNLLPSLRSVTIPADYRADFNQRLDFLVAEYEKAAKVEMFDLLKQMPADQAFKEYMEYHYGDTPMRAECLDIILRNINIQGGGDTPTFGIPMEKISAVIQKWANTQPSKEKKKEAIEAVNHLLKTLFEKNGKMEVFWNKQVQKIDDFYHTGDFPTIGANKTALEKLIRWARGEAREAGIDLPPEEKPHVALRKWTGLIELGVGGIALGTYFGLGELPDSDGKYYGRGAAIMTMGAGFGAMAGNLTSFAFNVNGGYDQWFDVGGAVLGAGSAAAIYFLTQKRPTEESRQNPNCSGTYSGNCIEFPDDQYGKSFPFMFNIGGSFK